MKKFFFMNSKIITRIGILFTCLLILSCSSGSEYSKLIEREMSTGVIHDSLLFDMKFGQHRMEFLSACWQLNQQGLVSNGPGNKTVKYKLPLSANAPLESEITLLFFGDFNDDKIMTGMDLEFFFSAWSIWNKKLQSDKLVPAVMDTLKKWYPGNDFIKVPLEKDSTHLLVKVDGNRRIVIRPIDDDRIIKAKIDDLRYVLDGKKKNDVD